MESNVARNLMFWIFGLFIGVILAAAITTNTTRELMEKQAVAHNAAHYVPSADKNNPIFKWNDEVK
jgi:hypothetical protein